MCNMCGFVSESLMPESGYWKKMCEYIVDTKKEAFQQNGCTAVCTCYFYKNPIREQDCFAFVNGKVFNFKHIKHILYLRGISLETDSLAELILKGFFTIGKNIFKILSGEFSGAIWDGYNRELVLFRDKMGFCPMFYYFDGQRISFCDKLAGLLKFPFVKADFCPDICCRLFTLSGCKIKGETFFENIFEVPPAGYIVYKNKKVESFCYYTYPAEIKSDSYRQTATGLEFLMKDSVFAESVKEKVLKTEQIIAVIKQMVDDFCMPLPYVDFKDLGSYGDEGEYTSNLSAFDIPVRLRIPVKMCREKELEFINGFLSTLPAFPYKDEKEIVQKEEFYIKTSLVLPQVITAKKSAHPNLRFPYLDDRVFEYSLRNLKHGEKILKNYIKPGKTKPEKENIKNLKSLFYIKCNEKDFMAGFLGEEEIVKLAKASQTAESMIYLLQVNEWLNKFL